jgi:hypothetical protein
MSNYDESPLIANLRRAYWSSDEDAGQIWGTFKDHFVRMDGNSRRQSLTVLDKYLEDEDRLTHEHADLLTKKRELSDLHLALHRAGR